MKYILICTAALVICFGAGFALSRLVWKRKSKLFCGVATVIIGFCLMLGATVGYLSVYFHGDERAETALTGSDGVTVTKIDTGYFFDGAGSRCALIFYPGAKVECKAYAPLMLALAERGIDCFAVEMPAHFALLGQNLADVISEKYSYDTWILAGHSLGGLTAARYACAHTDTVDGIVLLAAYSTVKIDNGIKVLSVYGTEDGCLNKTEYEKNRENWSFDAKEVVLEGGNHAQFGDYGTQNGDGTASLFPEEQQRLTAEAIAACFLGE